MIVDAFCGAGGNTIQFAFTCERGGYSFIDNNCIRNFIRKIKDS